MSLDKHFKQLNCQKGSISVEFAICIPAIMLLIGIIVYISSLCFMQIQLTNAVGKVARKAIELPVADISNQNPQLLSIVSSQINGAELNISFLDQDYIRVELTKEAPYGPMQLVAKNMSAKVIAQIED